MNVEVEREKEALWQEKGLTDRMGPTILGTHSKTGIKEVPVKWDNSITTFKYITTSTSVYNFRKHIYWYAF